MLNSRPEFRFNSRASTRPEAIPMPLRATVLAPLLAGAVVMAAAPAQAEFFFRPFGGVYVERYYEPLPPGGYYPEPLPPAPVYRAPARFPFADVEPMLRSMGMRALGPVRVDGNTYVVDATDPAGVRVRVRIDAFNGRILAMVPTGAAPVARQAPPKSAGPAPLPPRKPPEIAAVTVPAPPPVTGPEAAPVTPSPDASASGAPASEAPQPAAATPENGPVRVIPGIATPPGTAPQKAAEAPADSKTDSKPDAPPASASAPASPPETAPSAPSTGTGTASTTPAGTASVLARDNGRPAPPAD